MAFGREYALDISGKTYADDKLAVAQIIQNLCLIEPGTYPSDPELGIGIEDEQFELVDNAYLNSLKSKIDNQINKYIPSDYYITTELTSKAISANESRQVLCLSVTISSSSKDATNYKLLFMKKENGKLISRVIF